MLILVKGLKQFALLALYALLALGNTPKKTQKFSTKLQKSNKWKWFWKIIFSRVRVWLFRILKRFKFLLFWVEVVKYILSPDLRARFNRFSCTEKNSYDLFSKVQLFSEYNTFLRNLFLYPFVVSNYFKFFKAEMFAIRLIF